MSGLAAAKGASGEMIASTGRPVPLVEAVLFQYSMYSFWYWRLRMLIWDISDAEYSFLSSPYNEATGKAMGSPERPRAAWTWSMSVKFVVVDEKRTISSAVKSPDFELCDVSHCQNGRVLHLRSTRKLWNELAASIQ